jgi:hypothetical protein
MDRNISETERYATTSQKMKSERKRIRCGPVSGMLQIRMRNAMEQGFASAMGRDVVLELLNADGGAEDRKERRDITCI